MYVLGGTDGNMLSSSLWKIDFKAKRAENLEVEYETATSLNKLGVIEEKGSIVLHSLGGAKSEGLSYSVNLN
jgi:hypothetical protein